MPPWALIRPTISLLTLPMRTMRTTSMAAASVTRRPSTKLTFMPSFSIWRDTCGPAAVDDDGVHADELEEHDVGGELVAQVRRTPSRRRRT